MNLFASLTTSTGPKRRQQGGEDEPLKDPEDRRMKGEDEELEDDEESWAEE